MIEHLNDPHPILVADPTGFAKKGKKSAGVQRQYSGTLGRIDNCHIGTFLAYVTSNRDRVLIDRELYIPHEAWFGDPDRCAEAAIPEDLTFTTRPMQVMAMIERARWSELTFSWFTADEEFGHNPALRTYREQAEISYVLAIPKNTEFTDHTGRRATIAHRAARLAPNQWQRRSCGIGTTGFRVYDGALLDSDDPDDPYLIRRSLNTKELAFYHCYNPRREGFGDLVLVAGARWPIEECFESSKGGVGLDDYQVRLYHAWYRHITLAMLAHALGDRLRPPPQEHKKGDPSRSARTPTTPPSTIIDTATASTQTPPTRHRRRKIPLTLAEVRRLFTVVDLAKDLIEHALHWSNWRREHQAEARWHHFRRRLKIQYVAL